MKKKKRKKKKKKKKREAERLALQRRFFFFVLFTTHPPQPPHPTKVNCNQHSQGELAVDFGGVGWGGMFCRAFGHLFFF